MVRAMEMATSPVLKMQCVPLYTSFSSTSALASDGGSKSFPHRWPRGKCPPLRVSKNACNTLLYTSERQDYTSRDLPESSVSRRDVLQTTLVLCGSTVFQASSKEFKAFSEEEEEDLTITKRVFFDIAVDKQPIGKVVVGLYGTNVPIGAQRFADLAVGQRGIGYRRKEFSKVTPNYIQNNGVHSFSLSGRPGDAASITGGDNNESLVAEMAELDRKGSRLKNVANTVSLVVVDPTKPPPKTKLVAKGGKFVVLEEESRPDPNGTEFMIVTTDSPQLDASNLVVGRVVEGYDVLKRIGEVKVVNENFSSPYFRIAKLIGDTRAVVAERGFFRPYSKIVITNSGELQ